MTSAPITAYFDNNKDDDYDIVMVDVDWEAEASGIFLAGLPSSPRKATQSTCVGHFIL